MIAMMDMNMPGGVRVLGRLCEGERTSQIISLMAVEKGGDEISYQATR